MKPDPRLGCDFHFGSTKLPGLAKLLEEMGEFQAIAGKVIALGGSFTGWNGEDLLVPFLEEAADLRAALMFFLNENFFGKTAGRSDAKLNQYLEWHREGRWAKANQSEETPVSEGSDGQGQP